MEAPSKRKLFKNNLISEIPYQERRKICMLLDSRDDWKRIVGLIKAYDGTGPRYDDIHIMMFEREKSRAYGSPTDCLLNDWRSIRPKIVDLMDVLVSANLINVANYVSENVLLDGKINLPVMQPDDGPSLDGYMSDEYQGRGLHTGQSTGSSYVEHAEPVTLSSLDPNLVKSISAFAKDQSIPTYTYDELEKFTEKFDEESLDDGGRLLGVGGYGKVFFGVRKHNFTEELFAVKRFNKDAMNHLKTLKSELDAIFLNLKHPNLLRILGVCHDIHFCVLYEYMTSGTLDKCLYKSEEPLKSQERINIAIDVAKAIQFLHNSPHTIVHRDIKPANILLGDKMNAKLGDFGLIRVQNLVDNGHTNVTQDVHGTTLYMPPEAMQGVISPKWDIYSFGVVLLELLFGKGPGYTTKDNHTEKMIEAVFDEDHFEDLPLHLLDEKCDWNEDIAKVILELVERCGMKRSKRPEISGSAASVLETLLRCQQVLPPVTSNQSSDMTVAGIF